MTIYYKNYPENISLHERSCIKYKIQIVEHHCTDLMKFDIFKNTKPSGHFLYYWTAFVIHFVFA